MKKISYILIGAILFDLISILIFYLYISYCFSLFLYVNRLFIIIVFIVSLVNTVISFGEKGEKNLPVIARSLLSLLSSISISVFNFAPTEIRHIATLVSLACVCFVMLIFSLIVLLKERKKRL